MRGTLIRGARVIDGSGAPWIRADVLLHSDRIAAVGAKLEAGDCAVVEAADRYLAPGFIDAHCHDDLIFLREPERPEKALQGVTTIVVGNCSFSLYPVLPGSSGALREHFSALLGETRAEEMFADFAAYRQALHGRGIALNVVSLVGHAALRLAVMGYENRAATAEEVARMQDLLACQLAEGAAGLSLGLVYPPSAYADTAELVALGETVRTHGGVLAAHIRNYESELLASVDEFVEILRAAGVAGLLSHLQCGGRPNWGGVPHALRALEAAREGGVDVSFDMYPYPAGSTSMLQLLPPAIQEGGLEQMLRRLRDPDFRAGLRRWVEQDDSNLHASHSKVALIGWDNILVSGVDNPALKRFEGMRLDAAAQAAGLAPFDMMLRLIEEDAGQTAVILFQLHEDDLHAACTHALFMVGSDGLPRPGSRPHPRAYGTFPRVIGRLSREQGWLPLEDAIRRMTSAAAQRFGLQDRGLVRPGMAADLVLFTPGTIDRATFENPVQYPEGITDVWVAGQAVVRDGAITGLRPGRVLGAGSTG